MPGVRAFGIFRYLAAMKTLIASAMKSWKTTVIGFVAYGAAIYMFIKGSPWENVAGAATFGTGMLFAKDSNVTHSGNNAQPS